MPHIGEDLDSFEIDCHLINEAEQYEVILTHSYNLKILTLNIRSITKNFDNLLIAIKRMRVNLDILCLMEYWLNDNTTVPQIPGYTSYNTTKFSNQNGGVVVNVRDLWNAVSKEPILEDANSVIIEIPNVVTIFAVYRSPSCRRADNFLNSLDTNLALYDDRRPFILTGDININIGNMSD
ncbi:unnamed protein product [Arctia plantaginis]|uniref:Endonuclease/exonuclease/phosphatase domain-containing protein n=1 Tax=Arctia plantaginis TaxID=874455 RepID=A0A8S1A7I3_ARCPL|nr:unnamed protein product [Arctia plantaginis]